MNGTDIISLGYPQGELVGSAKMAAAIAESNGVEKNAIEKRLTEVLHNPDKYLDHDTYGELAQKIKEHDDAEADQKQLFQDCHEKTWKAWGIENIQSEAIDQLKAATCVPMATRAAIMPDGHLGYGLPVGGVLATKGAVIPYAVGVDIACRMKLSVLDTPLTALTQNEWNKELDDALEVATRFGLGCHYDRHELQYHPVMDDNRWNEFPFLNNLKSTAWEQLGTSGSGNHFVEFGVLTMDRPDNGTGQCVGQYLAILSHSGSRKTGADVCSRYSKIARDKLPKELQEQFGNLAWLDLDSEAGHEYWEAMNLMGDYASANHDVIHHRLARRIGAQIIGGIENHHNFAWKETHFGEEVIVHRKGATPAAEGEFGVIPGSMGTPAFLVRGKGNEESLKSASHGAGRAMSRSQAKKIFSLEDERKRLAEQGIRILSAGDDEVTGVYKDIHEVMKQQTDLVDKVGRFDPKIVKMSGDGSRAED